MSIHVKPVLFAAGKELLSAQLYLPRGVSRPPVLLMAHGFGSERRQCLPGYAWHFADRGMAVLVFDYRQVGEANSRPRQQINPRRHLEDYAAALAFAQAHPELDGDRIALWGINLSGGHALVTAARYPGAVRAVVAQSPHVDGGFRADTYPSRLSHGAFWHPTLDLVGSALAQPAIGIPMPARRGPRGIAAPLTADWDHSIPARIHVRVPCYRPILELGAIRCPTLVITLPGADAAQGSALSHAVAAIPGGRLERLAAVPRLSGSGDDFRDLVRLQADFLCHVLAIPARPRRRRPPARPRLRTSGSTADVALPLGA